MKLYTYRFNKQYSYHAGLSVDKVIEDMGVLGRELVNLIPDAVTEAVRLSNIRVVLLPLALF